MMREQAAILARLIGRLVGAPFKDKGRGLDGVDCWGVVWLAHKAIGNDLPLYGDSSFQRVEDVAELIKGETAARPWLLADGARQAFDMAVLSTPVKAASRWVSLDCHVGLVTGPGWLLHCEEHVGVVHVPLDHHTVRRRVRRVYRHEALA